jgi:hypothetical protein
MSRSPTARSCQASLTKHSRSNFALTVVCWFLPSLSSGDADDSHQWEVQASSTGFGTRACHRCRVVEESFHL